MSDVKEMTFDELREWATRHAFDALIMGGTKEMKSAFFAIFNVAFQWHNYHVVKGNDIG